jgi:gluconolactonase
MKTTPLLYAACGVAAAALLFATSQTAGAAKTNALAEIVTPGTPVEKVAGGFRFTEGPVWDGGSLLFSDIPADTLFKYVPGVPKPDVFRRPSGQTNGNTLDSRGRLISCEHGNRRVSRTERDGTVKTIADQFENKRLNSPNDVVVRTADGSLYFTDPPYGIGKEQEELGFYGVYRIAPDGTLTLLIRDFVRPNGLAFSPDEKRLYVNDSETGHIRVFDVAKNGTLGKGRVFAGGIKIDGKPGVPDGMKVDVRGNVYCTGPEGVWVFSPKGELLGKIPCPETPANIGWGDRDLKTLYITAQTGLYRVRCNVSGVRAGGPR